MDITSFPISDGTRIVKISGDISGIESCSSITEVLDKAMNADRVYLDLSDVDFAGSVFLNALISFAKKHRENLKIIRISTIISVNSFFLFLN